MAETALEKLVQESETFQEAYDAMRDEISAHLQTPAIRDILNLEEDKLPPQNYCNLVAALEDNAMNDTIYQMLQEKALPEVLIPKEELTNQFVHDVLDQSDLALDTKKLLDNEQKPVSIVNIPNSIHEEVKIEIIKEIESVNQDSVCVFLPRETIDDIKDAGTPEMIDAAAKSESFGEDAVLVMTINEAKAFAETTKEIETPELARTIDNTVKEAIQEHADRAKVTSEPTHNQSERQATRSRSQLIDR